MNCPGSVQLSELAPDPGSSRYADEGTAAHALAELALRNNAGPHTYVGLAVEGYEITEDMADNVGVFVDYCRSVPHGPSWIEQHFNLASLNPPAPMFGTADFVAYDDVTRTLHVVDLKYGMGVVVEAKGNKQLRYYGLGALLASQHEVDRVVLTIVQPRALHPDGFIRHDTLTMTEMLDFAGELLAAARATQAPDAPLVTGAHCRFCPAIAICPAKHAEAQEIAQTEFSVMPAVQPPVPATLPSEVFADVLSKLDILESWIHAMRREAQWRLESGEPVPGFKLVAKRPTRKFADPEHAEQYLLADGFDRDDITESKLKSVAQIEKLFPKKKLPPDLAVAKVSSGYNVVPEHDKREAVILSAAHEFDALPAPESTSTEGTIREHEDE